MKQPLTIKLIDPSLPLPEYHTKGAAAFDVYSRVSLTVPPWSPTIIPLNIVVQTPPGHFLLLAARSSTAKKFGLMLANGIGVIDEDYCGEQDEVGLNVLNFTKKTVHIARGERVGQALLVKISRPSRLKAVKKMGSQSRGGFGTTGHEVKSKPAKTAKK